ncbi:hypothetical protein GO001_14300 [Streptomyces sp. NRRL B-1677]|uniref:hypothetical protein n=1 Tax=Streptomyces sp. NRRL B-1677 TaxID=2682966 RepID=UPI001892C69B|nr:hypothetical protein [Streptomyces sp. NRRL B-1677]MBF6046382.1 hypothetical protein [Streptomyces sp. NRRL B-1677]
MFEIRITCATADTDRIVAALDSTFAVGIVSVFPTRDGRRNRLYASADYHPETGEWPSPEEAYALAPSIVREIGWTARTAADKAFGEDMDREYWLRKAALLDRVALLDEPAPPFGDATEAAHAAAVYLLDSDRVEQRLAERAEKDPRGYVRQEYARWAKNQ